MCSVANNRVVTTRRRFGKTLITVREAAEILGLPKSTVYNRKAGTAKLTRVKQGALYE
jgi:hypothetical protein